MTQLFSRTCIELGLPGLQSVCTQVNSLNICVDPRLELLAVVQWLSIYGSRFPLLSRYEFPYKAAVVVDFTAYQDHEIIDYVNELFSKPISNENPPFAFGAPPEVMLYLDPDFVLREDIFTNTFLVGRAGGTMSVKQLVELFRRFYNDSSFASFYRSHQPLYAQMVSSTVNRIGARDYIAELEQLYGMQLESYTLILVPLYHSVGFGPCITVDGKQHVYNIMGPRGIQDGVPEFGSEAYLTEMQRHEFSHSFINPLTEQYWEVATPYFTTYASPIEAQELVNESIVRAVTTWLAFTEGDAQGKEALRHEQERGFEVVPALVKLLEKYADNRSSYPTISQFYPQLLAAFKGHSKGRYTPNSTVQIGDSESS
jgi:hypothetical protein